MSRLSETRKYLYLEPALEEANKNYIISCNRREAAKAKVILEKIIWEIVAAMKKQSPTFARFYYKTWNGGSVYEQTKIGKVDEFDFDILIKIPEEMGPVLKVGDVAGFAQLQVKNFDNFQNLNPEMHKVFNDFVDHDKYILSKKMMTTFVWKILDKALLNFFPNLKFKVHKKTYKITKIAYMEPAVTLTIEGPNFYVDVDLVTSFVFAGHLWPQYQCRGNPYVHPNEFLLAPTVPKDAQVHRERFWRLSFHMQERKLLFNRQRMKPALRVLKRIRDHFGQSVRSYAIKTIFFWELCQNNLDLDKSTPDLWKTPLSYVVTYMLEKYLQCLMDGQISDFWSPKLNLLCYLTDEEIQKYTKDISTLVEDIKTNPHSNSLLKYLMLNDYQP